VAIVVNDYGWTWLVRKECPVFPSVEIPKTPKLVEFEMLQHGIASQTDDAALYSYQGVKHLVHDDGLIYAILFDLDSHNIDTGEVACGIAYAALLINGKEVVKVRMADLYKASTIGESAWNSHNIWLPGINIPLLNDDELQMDYDVVASYATGGRSDSFNTKFYIVKEK